MKRIIWCLLLAPLLVVRAQNIDSSHWQIKNLNINTSANEYLPFYLDSIVVFTSDRSHTSGSTLTTNAEQNYQSTKGKNDTTWSPVRSLSFTINGENDAAIVGIDSHYFYTRKGFFPENGEVFVSKRSAKKLTNSKNLVPFPWNSSADESAVAVRKDEIYFVSNRYGNYDILYSSHGSLPVRVDNINSSFDEQDVWITAGGDSLYFSSNRLDGMGGYDCYLSVWNGSIWLQPIPLKEINSSWDDRDFRWYGNKGIFSSNRIGGKGGYDLYEISPLPTPSPSLPDTLRQDSLVHRDSLITSHDSIPMTVVVSPPIVHPIQHVLDSLGLWPFLGEIQLAAHGYTIKTITKFITRYPNISQLPLRKDSVWYDNVWIHRFIIDSIYTDIDSALADLQLYTETSGLPTTNEKRPFIALLKDKETRSRYAIFWRREEYDHTLLWITKDNLKIWEYKK